MLNTHIKVSVRCMIFYLLIVLDTKYCFLFNKFPVLTGKNLSRYHSFSVYDINSASTSTSSTLTHHPDPQSSENTRIPPEPSTPHGHHHSTESGNQNAQNTAPNNSTGTQNPAQAPQKELTEEQKKIEKQKRELEALLETVDQTEKIIFMAFPFQEAIVLGNFYATFPNTMKTIRIFTSSTFTGKFRYL